MTDKANLEDVVQDILDTVAHKMGEAVGDGWTAKVVSIDLRLTIVDEVDAEVDDE